MHHIYCIFNPEHPPPQSGHQARAGEGGVNNRQGLSAMETVPLLEEKHIEILAKKTDKRTGPLFKKKKTLMKWIVFVRQRSCLYM